MNTYTLYTVEHQGYTSYGNSKWLLLLLDDSGRSIAVHTKPNWQYPVNFRTGAAGVRVRATTKITRNKLYLEEVETI